MLALHNFRGGGGAQIDAKWWKHRRCPPPRKIRHCPNLYSGTEFFRRKFFKSSVSVDPVGRCGWGDESQRKKVIIYREADEYLFFDEGRSEEEQVSVFV